MPKASKPETKTKTSSPNTLGRQLEKAFDLTPEKMAALKGEFRSIAAKHLDPFVTFTDQRPVTLENIEKELIATLPEFQEETLRTSRVQLSMRYIQYYFHDSIRRGKTVKKEPEEISLAGSNNNNCDGKSPDTANPTSNPSSSQSSSSNPHSLAAPTVSNPVSDIAPEIKTFLKSFTPSLLYLCPTFIKAGLVSQEALDTLAAWPRASIRDFLRELTVTHPFASAQGQGGQAQGAEAKLGKVVVEAIVLRFKGHEHEY
ncbi:hypothetical protein MSAN_00429100 [Mycena sanguinolenta]|uniref:Uncharacterized protein n=1 Tax=Mycena sanguinolenta TaxID=230812 RepID=A0A8H7DID1_9AGAR|nr:hypothetical protein MSAN_00429100 [Mycena sanguinolenta]